MITWRNVTFFLISGIVLGPVQIYWQLHLIELLGFLIAGATQVVAHDIFKAFDRVWRAGLLHKLRSYGTAGQIFGLISSFLSNRQLQVVLDRKSSQEYPVNPQGSILGTTLFQLYINDLLMILLVIHGVTWCNLTQTKKIQKKIFL